MEQFCIGIWKHNWQHCKRISFFSINYDFVWRSSPIHPYLSVECAKKSVIFFQGISDPETRAYLMSNLCYSFNLVNLVGLSNAVCGPSALGWRSGASTEIPKLKRLGQESLLSALRLTVGLQDETHISPILTFSYRHDPSSSRRLERDVLTIFNCRGFI